MQELRADHFAPDRDARVKLYPVVAKAAISVVGLGYVGSVTAGCLSDLGHRIIGVDVDPLKVAAIRSGTSPMYEEGLDELLADGVARGTIEATHDLADAVARTDVTLVSVGTPTAADGSCDLRYVEAVADQLGSAIAGLDRFHVVVLRSSVPPGTTHGVVGRRIEEISGKSLGVDFGLAFAPEFLREGEAVSDFRDPPKTVIGASDPRTEAMLARIFEPVDNAPILSRIETAELVKYVDNVWHAAKVCFANEVGRLSKAMGIDGREVMDVFCEDTKLNISARYLKPGFAYGGSCLPKEVRAAAHIGAGLGVELPMIDSLARSNEVQVKRAVELIRATGARRVAVLGLAFKPGTDDLRESAILDVVARLMADGIDVTAHDAHFASAGHLAQRLSGDPRTRNADFARMAAQIPSRLAGDAGQAIAEADAVIVNHDIPAYRALLDSCELPIVDLAQVLKRKSGEARYEGIGW